jgi:hypothetical protein
MLKHEPFAGGQDNYPVGRPETLNNGKDMKLSRSFLKDL